MPYEYKDPRIPKKEHDAIKEIIKHDLALEEILQKPGVLIGTDIELNNQKIEKDLQNNQYIDKKIPPSLQSEIDTNISEVRKNLDTKFTELENKYKELDKLERLEKTDLNMQNVSNLIKEIKELEDHMMKLNDKIDN